MSGPLQSVCRFIARRMHAADASYPNPRLAAWIRRTAWGIPPEDIERARQLAIERNWKDIEA